MTATPGLDLAAEVPYAHASAILAAVDYLDVSFSSGASPSQRSVSQMHSQTTLEMEAVRLTPSRAARASIDEPAKSALTSPSTVASERRRCTGFESRPSCSGTSPDGPSRPDLSCRRRPVVGVEVAATPVL
jgi:hypothetical protein